jgi:hypothetical protein
LGPASSHLEYKSEKLGTENEFFLFMIKLRLNKEDQDLGYMFDIHRKTVGILFKTWLNFLYFQLKELNLFLPKDIVQAYMPDDFKAKYPSTRYYSF